MTRPCRGRLGCTGSGGRTTTGGIDPEEALLLRRLAERDPTAPADLAERYLADVQRSAAAAFPSVDEHLVTTAAIDAILGVARHQHRVDLGRGSLRAYLVMSAKGDLRNALRSRERRRARETSLDAVEVSVLERNIHRHDPGADPTAELAIAAAHREAAGFNLRGVVRDPAESAVLKAMLEGERRTSVFAELLGLTGLDLETQRAEVKKVKDKLNQRLRRAGRRAPS